MPKIKMDERMWTLVVILLIVSGIGIYKLAGYINRRSEHSVTFKNCTIKYGYVASQPGWDYEQDRAATARLAICLCQSYLQKPDTAIARKILEIYKNDDRHDLFDTLHNKNYNKLDSVIEHRKMVFDTVALLD